MAVSGAKKQQWQAALQKDDAASKADWTHRMLAVIDSYCCIKSAIPKAAYTASQQRSMLPEPAITNRDLNLILAIIKIMNGQSERGLDLDINFTY